jgi:hypothetical protein
MFVSRGIQEVLSPFRFSQLSQKLLIKLKNVYSLTYHKFKCCQMFDGSYECSNKPPGSVKGEKFIDQLSDG